MAACPLFHSPCSAGVQTWETRFAPELPLYPFGLPQAIGSIYLINRIDGGLGTRINGGVAYTSRIDGSQVATYPLLPALVTSLAIAPIALPDPTLTSASATEEQRQTLARYVAVYSAPAQ